MKYIKQFSIIITVSFLGEVLHALLPLPIPWPAFMVCF